MPKKEKLPKQKKPPKQAKHVKQQKKRKGRSVQDFIGVKTFTKYGLMTQKGELLFYLVSPTNISVLSYVNIEIKIRHLMMVLSSIPDILLWMNSPQTAALPSCMICGIGSERKSSAPIQMSFRSVFRCHKTKNSNPSATQSFRKH